MKQSSIKDQEIKRKIHHFLKNYQELYLNSRKPLMNSCHQKNVQKISGDFEKHFNGEKITHQISLQDYLLRIFAQKYISTDILICACFFMKKALKSDKLPQSYGFFTVKLFGVCLNISQKYLLDVTIEPKVMRKIIGIPKNKLLKKEIFLLDEILEMDIFIKKNMFDQFTETLITLKYDQKS